MTCVYIYTAIPVLEPTVTRLLAIVESVHTLECPYELGTASDHIHPYHHIWLNTDESNNNVIPNKYNRTLNVSTSEVSPDVTTYTCALRMQECSACEQVVDYPALNRPQFQLTKVGKFICLCIMRNESLCTISLQCHFQLMLPLLLKLCLLVLLSPLSVLPRERV